MNKDICWTVDGIVYFSVLSKGLTAQEWTREHSGPIQRKIAVAGNMFNFGPILNTIPPFSGPAKNMLISEHFSPTTDVETIVAIMGDGLFNGGSRSTEQICAKAADMGLSRPSLEHACLIRQKLTDRQIKGMGLGPIVVMHDLFQAPGNEGVSGFIVIDPRDDIPGLGAFPNPQGDWEKEAAFAFIVPTKKL